MTQRTRKAPKSKAIVKDKDDEVEFISGPADADVTMGASDGPITAASGADSVRYFLHMFFRAASSAQLPFLADGY